MILKKQKEIFITRRGYEIYSALNFKKIFFLKDHCTVYVVSNKRLKGGSFLILFCIEVTYLPFSTGDRWLIIVDDTLFYTV